MYKFILFVFLLFPQLSMCADNLVLITIDGVRWQEVFSGIDKDLMKHPEFSKKSKQLEKRFWSENESKRVEKLMPFISKKIAEQGSMIGDRRNGSYMSVSNPWYFSYPGYSEIFTGVVNESINSNKAINNPQINFLEWLNRQPKYGSKLAVFGSWDLYPYIFNSDRSKLHVNSGFTPAKGYPLTNEALLLNQLQEEIPSPWHNVRHDSFTYRYAMDYLQVVKPKVIVIAFGETDDFAHEGKYDEYIMAINRTDKMIASLWKIIQSTEGYANNTHLVITTDHGRGGTISDWKHHASVEATKGYLNGLKKFPQGIIGSENTWLAAIGPKIKSQGLLKSNKEFKHVQIASTVLRLLQEDPLEFQKEGGLVIEELIQIEIGLGVSR